MHKVTSGGRVAVVGSGASGLAAAFHLERSGFAVDLIEREPTLGGRFGVSVLGERPVMIGGKNVGRRYTSFRAFVASLGGHPWEPFGINSSRVKDGELVTLDSTRRARSMRTVLRARPRRDLLRLAALAARVRANEANRFVGSPYFTALGRRSDHAPLAAHFNRGLCDYALRPMTIRMNGAEPDEVYLGTFNTNLALMMDTFDQLRFGIQPVLDAFAERVTVKLGAQVESLAVADRRVAGLWIAEGGDAAREHAYDGVVVATPAYAAAAIVEAAAPPLAALLREPRYFPSTVVLVEYDRPVFTPEVRALAMDDGPCTNAGSYGAEDRNLVRYTFSGREARTPDPSPEQVARWVDGGEEHLLRNVASARGAERVRSVSRHWSAAYCAYGPYHGDRVQATRRAAAGLPGLELAGDYLRGASIEACFRAGTEAGVGMAAQLGGPVAAPQLIAD